MDNIKNQSKKEKSDAVKSVDDDDSSQKPAANLSITAANSSQVPFADTSTMTGRRGESVQRPVVASATGRLKGESTEATLPLSSLHLSSDQKHNSKVTGIMLKAGALSDRQLDTSAKQQVYTKEETTNRRPTHVDSDTTNSSDKKAMKNSLNTHDLDKNLVSKSVVHNSTPLFCKHSVKSTGKDQLQEKNTSPGAMAMFPGGNGRPVLLPPNNDITFMNADHNCAQAPTVVIGASDIEEGGEPTLKAFLVNDDTGVVASATILDVEAEEKKNQRRRMRTILGSFITASIIATAVAVPVVLTQSGSAQTVVGTPTSSPVPSAVPSFTPTSSPSTALFGFLAANSFDGGSALDIPGSPQQMALDWLVNVSGIFEMDYHLLQNYALVTFYFETAGQQWISTEDFDFKRSILQSSTIVNDETFKGEWLNVTPSVNPLGFCNWLGVVCSDNREIDSLILSDSRLKGSIPAELGILHKSLSKSFIICIAQKIFAANDMHIFEHFNSPLYPHLLHFVYIGIINFTSNSLDGTLPSSLATMANLGR